MSLHKWITNQQQALADKMRDVESSNDRAMAICKIMERHGISEDHAYCQDSGLIAINIFPDKIDEIAPFLRDMREYLGEKMPAEMDPDNRRIVYYTPRVLIVANLNRTCKFKKVGEETVTKPIYEISCD